ncbi:MAG: hypothetical protein ACJ76I_12860 [Gaiellaceae bacterium]
MLVAALAGCGGGRLPRGSVSLPPLPAQGLIDESRGGVALRDMHGRRLAWLRRFAVSPSGTSVGSAAAYGYVSAQSRAPLLHGPQGSYRLDVARHALVPFEGAGLQLADDTRVVAPPGYTLAVERKGRVVLRGSWRTFRILSPRLVQSGTTLLDVRTQRTWKLPSGCLTGGFHAGTLILACGIAHAAEGAAPLRLERLAPGSAARPTAPPLAELIPETVALSPDRRWVAVEGDTGCAASYVYVAPTRGGPARLVYGRSVTNPFAANFSSLLGWSADGRLVVRFEPQHCDAEPYGPQHPPHGVYLVDPRTLARTFVTRAAVAMWNPAPRFP